MSFIKDLFSSKTKDLVDATGNLIDKVSTSDEEKLKLKENMTNLLTSSLQEMKELQASLIKAEMGGNWLQRSWRPLTMLAFVGVVLIATFFEVKLNKVPEDFWQLLMIGMGGYIGGRTIEKIADKGMKNIDIPFLKKKDRKDHLQ